MNDLVAGHAPLGSITWRAARGRLRGGTIIPLAVSAGRRTPEFPRRADPARTGISRPRRDHLVRRRGARRVAARHPRAYEPGDRGGACAPAVRDCLAAEDFEFATRSPAELTAFIQAELAKWGLVAKKLAPDAAR